MASKLTVSEILQEEWGRSQDSPPMPQGCLTGIGDSGRGSFRVFLSTFTVLLLQNQGLGSEEWEVPRGWEVSSATSTLNC